MDSSPSTPSRKRALVIVGAGMAAHAVLRRLSQNGGLDQYSVTLLGDEPRPCYDRVNLTECFSGKSPEALELSPRAWYAEQGIKLLTGARATAIDRRERLITTVAGQEIPYDQLILATGSRPFVPPIPGTDLPGVFVYRTIEDIDAIRAYAPQCQTAAVLGGGLLGLEAAKALYDLGLSAHVLEVAPGLMPRQLNSEASTLLKREIESLGVKVHLPRRAVGIQTAEQQREVQFAGHDPLKVDMVVISAGIRPRDELARVSDLAVGERGGIAVDMYLRTQDPRIYAIGECASLGGKLFGLVGPCYEMAHIVADNLTAQAVGDRADASFVDKAPTSRLKLLGVDVATLGPPIGEAAGGSVIVHQGEQYCRSLIVEKGKLISAIGVGDWPEREQLNDLVARTGRISQRQLRRFRATGQVWAAEPSSNVSDWPAGATVCSCLNITRGQLTTAMREGADTAEALSLATGAASVCGSCRNLLCNLAGESEAPASTTKRPVLLATSLVAALLAPTILAVEPQRFSGSVQSTWQQIELLWQDSLAKQVTGYVLLAIMLLSLLLSLRKRMTWFRLGDFILWRGLHGLLGTGTLIGFLVHTGMKLGHNFTFVLAAIFLALNLLGAFTGMAASIEGHASGPWAQRLRTWRPRLTHLHIWLFWPLPVLILFHIVSVYYY